MIVSILTGRKGSKAFVDKHFYKIKDKFLSYYPMMAAINCPQISKHYISTDDERLIQMAEENNMEIIRRPEELCIDEALSKDVFVHAYNVIKERNPNEHIDILVLLMCNAATITSDIISSGIKILQYRPDYDSAVTVSKYNMWSPARARKIGDDGLLHPFVPFKCFENKTNISSDRDSQGDTWFADMGVSIVRSRCIENIDGGLLPQQWMGQKIYPLCQELGFDIDYKWQISQLEEWLRRNYNIKDSNV